MSKIKKPIYGPPELDESKMTEKEVAFEKRKATLHKIRERKIKKAFRTYRFRGLKNFLFWFFGVLSSIGIVLGSIFVGVKVIPLSTYLKWSGQDSSQIVSENVSNKSVLDAILGYEEYKLSDLPFVETLVQDLLAETGADDFVVVDYDALKDVKFFNSTDDSDFIDEVAKCVKLNPEAELLRDIKAFSEYATTDCPLEKVNTEWVISADLGKGLYCFDVSTVPDASPLNVKYNTVSQVVYEDVFIDGKINAKLKSLSVEDMGKVEFYYKPICQLPIYEVIDNLQSIVNRLKIVDVMGAFKVNFEDGNLIYEILEDKTINEIYDITGDNIKLTSVLKYENNQEVYKILLSALNMLPEKEDGVEEDVYQANVKQKASEITVSKLSQIDPDNINLDVVLPESENQDLYDIIRNVKDMGPNDPVLLGSLSGFKDDDIKLHVVFEYAGSEDVYKIILSALNLMPVKAEYEEKNAYDLRVKEEAEKLTLGQLNNIKTDDVNLDVVLPESENKDLYAIIRNVKGMSPTQPIYLKDLEGFDDNEIPLYTVLDQPTEENAYKNKKLYDILLSALEITAVDENGDEYILTNPTYADIKIKHLSKFKIEDVRLELLLPYYDDSDTTDIKNNKELYKILLEATGTDLTGKTDSDIELLAKGLSLDVLTKFRLGGVRFANVITDVDDTLKEILGSSIVKNDSVVPYDEIRIEDLELFSVSNVKINLILPYYDATDPDNVKDNREIYKVLVEACGLGSAQKAESLAPTMSIADLNKFDMDRVSLSAVLKLDGNETLYDVLMQALTVADTDGNGLDYDDIKISNLSTFNTGNVKLSSVLSDKNNPDKAVNETLKTVLVQACEGVDNFEDITIADLLGDGFDMNNVELATVLGTPTKKEDGEDGLLDYGNHILNVLMSKGNVTIGNLGEKLDGLLLSEVYPSTAFDTTFDYANQKAYYKVEREGLEIFIHEDKIDEFAKEGDDITTKYFVSKDAHVWLFLHYANVWEDEENVILSGHDSLGNAYVYIDAHHSIAELQGDVDHMSNKIMDATIRQLVDAGIVIDNGGFRNDAIYSMTLGYIIDFMGSAVN